MNKRNEQLQTMSFEQLHARSVEFHGHSCPGLIIGIKAAMYVMELFHEAFSEDEELVCVAENDACGVDAIQSILGCSVGKGNLLFRMRGKHAYNKRQSITQEMKTERLYVWIVFIRTIVFY